MQSMLRSNMINVLFIAFSLSNLLSFCASICIANQESPLNQRHPICFAKATGNFSYYDAWKFCGSLCQESYHTQGFTCPALPDSFVQLEGLPTELGEVSTIFLNSRSNLKLYNYCTTARLAASNSSWQSITPIMRSCSDTVTMAICVALNFRMESSTSATTITHQTKAQIESEYLDYHRCIVEKINASPNGTWKATFNAAGIPDPIPFKSKITPRMLAKIKLYFSYDGSSGRPVTDYLDSETEEQILKQASLVRNMTQMITAWNGLEDQGTEVFPVEFDARLKWPKCSHMAQPTLNQGRCGSCYAVASIAVISDRICTFSNQSIDIHLSVSDFLSCVQSNQISCKGGSSVSVFDHWVDHGLVTGGAYGSNEGCWPYEIDNDCGMPCSMTDYSSQSVVSCRNECSDMYKKSYEDDRYFGKNSYLLVDPSDEHSSQFAERNMKWELMNRGPFTATMIVPEDFVHYKSGVYQYVDGSVVYSHAVRVLGWGVEDEVPYWLVSNSWGRNWGENGFFKILRGSNHLLIETRAVAGTPMT